MGGPGLEWDIRRQMFHFLIQYCVPGTPSRNSFVACGYLSHLVADAVSNERSLVSLILYSRSFWATAVVWLGLIGALFALHDSGRKPLMNTFPAVRAALERVTLPGRTWSR